MTIDPVTLTALSRAMEELDRDAGHPIPTGVIAALRDVARPGMRLTLDFEASRALGAPLVVLSETRSRAGLPEGLTRRQRQVAELVLSGRANRQIASELCISVATVKDHVHAILQRTGHRSRAALIAAYG